MEGERLMCAVCENGVNNCESYFTYYQGTLICEYCFDKFLDEKPEKDFSRTQFIVWIMKKRKELRKS